MNNISVNQYKGTDLAILAVITAVFEAITTAVAANLFAFEQYTLSTTIVMVCIVMMRWGGWAAIHAVIGGLAFCIAGGATPEQFAIYCIGNCASLLALLFFKFLGKGRVRKSWLLTAAFALAAYCGAVVGRWLVSFAFGGTLSTIIDFLVTDPLTPVFTVVVVLIARAPDGLFEDQKAYLIRTEDERHRKEDKDVF